MLCYLQELTYEEAARRAGCPVGALRGRLERGKERLRKRLAEYGLPLAAPALLLGPPAPVSAALASATLDTVRTVANGGRVPAAIAGLVGPRTGFRVAFLAPLAVALTALGAVLAGSERPGAVAEPPAPPAREVAGPPARVDPFGDPLPDGGLVRLGTMRSRAGIHTFGLRADGTVVTVGPLFGGGKWDQKIGVRTWGPRSDASEAPVPLPLKEYNPALFPQVSLDGRFVAAGTTAKVVVWEWTSRAKEVAAFPIERARGLALSPDGSRLAVAHEKVALCDVRTGAVRELEPGPAEVLCFSGDGRRLMAGSSERVVVWDVATGKRLADHKGETLGGGVPSALDHTGSVIAALPHGWGEDRVRFLDAITGEPVAGLTGPEVEIYGGVVTFAPDGKTVLLGNKDGVCWWDPAAGKLIRQFDAPSSTAAWFERQQARLTPDGKVLVWHTQQALFRWDATTGKPLFPQAQGTGHTEEVKALDISPDGTRVATLGGEPGVRVWDATTGRQLFVLPSSIPTDVDNADFSPDGRFLFTLSRKRDAVVKWDVATGKEITRYVVGTPEELRTSTLCAFRLAPNGRIVHGVLDDLFRKSARMVQWDAESGRILSERTVTNRGQEDGYQGSFSPDCRWFAGAESLFPVELGPTAKAIALEKARPIGMYVFSSDSRLLALTGWSVEAPATPSDPACHAVVLDVATGAKVFEMPVRWCTGFAFHPDGRSLAGAESDGLVFWDLVTGKEYARRKAHARHPIDPQPFARVMRYFPDGTKLVTGHHDTTALIWEAPVRPKGAKVLDEKGRAALWDDLASPDGAKGWGAVWGLADDPGAVAFLRGKVTPVPALPAKEFDPLLADLGSEAFATREAATEKLKAALDRATGPLRAALKAELTAEQKLRVEQLLAAWPGADRRPLTGDRLRGVRAVAALELAGTAGARKLLAELAAGAADATITREAKFALGRVSR
ncbi:hypothetical protein FTUN_5241 [Frigoriglobus tundricola]|uniref:Uncharacterized protein n=1 Tax=Frigoriglobus tundricola TaxID=2774151 RepID=A0A6M5YW07_9BACT|nr:hypothetical protein FTUN_5241 [Frigoriglobus tundricola]